MNQYDAPPNAPQSGNSVRIDTLDGRLTQAVAATDTGHNDKFALWTQHTVSGGAGSKVRWYEIYPSDPKLIQNGSVSNSSKYDFDGAISPNRAVNGSDKSGGKNMVLNFVASSGSSFPAIKMVSKKGGNSQSGQVAVKQSPGPIAGFDCSGSGGGGEPDGTSSQLCRWGDYASATPDPSNSSRIWNVSQWASGNEAGLHDGSRLPRDLEDADLRRQPLAAGVAHAAQGCGLEPARPRGQLGAGRRLTGVQVPARGRDQLGLGARRPYQGRLSAISDRRGAVLSRSESIGSEIGHSTATSGSSQAMPASVAGS